MNSRIKFVIGDEERTAEILKESNEKYLISENDFVTGNIFVSQKDNAYIISVDFTALSDNFSRENSCSICMELSEKCEMLSIHRYNDYWTVPVFKGEEAKKNIQKLLIRENDKYTFFLPVSDESLTEMSVDNNKISIDISTLCDNKKKISGVIAIIKSGDSYSELIKSTYKIAYDNNITETPLKDNKEYPEVFEGLGWCTWNAFYHNVTEEGIVNKLKELKEKNIKLSWLIIDDGWSETDDAVITSFYEDKKKFPNGLKSCIKKIKEEYGVKYVGIWHSFNAYWSGIKENSELYEAQKENLIKTDDGIILPAPEFKKAYAFFDAWHIYLKEQGIDFLKVDTQGKGLKYYQDVKGVKAVHKALEKSVMKNFDGNMINCMGIGNIDMFSRESTLVVRNSDDFFPNKEGGFKNHITQNIYNAIFNDDLCCCDFDMWWSNHVEARQSIVLRMLSGGPVYVSDEVGETNSKYLLKIMDEDGRIKRCKNAPKPTADCLFGYENVLKIYNESEDKYVVGIFNLSDKEESVSFCLSDIYQSRKYSAEFCFSKEKTEIENNNIEFSVKSQEVEVIVLEKI